MEIIAPAKINLMLHVTGRRDDGYHTLQSLIAFADIGDILQVAPASSFSLKVTGRFPVANDDSNLVTRAVRAMEKETGHVADIAVTLQKNLPVGAGLGGGSSDAAAIMRFLNDRWGDPFDSAKLADIGLTLGAELPVCLENTPCWIEGVGEKLTCVAATHTMNAVLVWPGQGLATADVFRAFASDPHYTPQTISEPSFTLLAQQSNNLTGAAISLLPVVADVLEFLQSQEGCAFARMSGSGSACFGIFKDIEAMKKAAETISAAHSNWWVQSCTIRC